MTPTKLLHVLLQLHMCLQRSTAQYQPITDIHTVLGPITLGHDDKRSSGSCATTESIVFCGLTSTSVRNDGAEMNGTHCVAINAEGNMAGTQAVTGCGSSAFTCTQYVSGWYDSSDEVGVECESQQETMLSCNARSAWSLQSAWFIGQESAETLIDSDASCTVQTDSVSATQGSFAAALCCTYADSDGYNRLECATQWGASVTNGLSIATCGDSQTVLGCSAVGSGINQVSSYYIDPYSNSCKAAAPSGSVRAAATCCRKYKRASCLDNGQCASVSAYCNGQLTVQYSADGFTYQTVSTTDGWHTPAFALLDDATDASSVLFSCSNDVGGIGNFMATLEYNGQTWSTTNPLDDGVYRTLSDDSSDTLQYNAKGAYGFESDSIADDAVWVWNNQAGSTMVFQVKLYPTPSPTEAPMLPSSAPIESTAKPIESTSTSESDAVGTGVLAVDEEKNEESADGTGIGPLEIGLAVLIPCVFLGFVAAGVFYCLGQSDSGPKFKQTPGEDVDLNTSAPQHTFQEAAELSVVQSGDAMAMKANGHGENSQEDKDYIAEVDDQGNSQDTPSRRQIQRVVTADIGCEGVAQIQVSSN